MFITHNDASIYAVEFGGGTRTLVAHGGWTGSWELWTEPFATLSKTWHTVAYDHRGTGVTTAPIDSITLEALTNDLFGVLDSLKIERCVLAAESAGAMVAFQAALQQPQRFDGLVIVSGKYYQPMPDAPNPFVMGLKSNYQATIGYFADSCVPETEPNCTLIRSWGRQILARASPAAAVRLLECLDGVDLRPFIPQITLPTLIIHGDQDALVPLSDAEWLASQLPNSHLKRLVGAGHVPTMTRPTEVAEAINQFFSDRMAS